MSLHRLDCLSTVIALRLPTYILASIAVLSLDSRNPHSRIHQPHKYNIELVYLWRPFSITRRWIQVLFLIVWKYFRKKIAARCQRLNAVPIVRVCILYFEITHNYTMFRCVKTKNYIHLFLFSSRTSQLLRFVVKKCFRLYCYSRHLWEKHFNTNFCIFLKIV